MRNMTEPNFETEGKHSVKNNHENSVLIGVRPEVPHPGLFLCRTVFEEGWAGEKKRSAQLIHYYGPSGRHRWCHNRIISMTGLSPLQSISIPTVKMELDKKEVQFLSGLVLADKICWYYHGTITVLYFQ